MSRRAALLTTLGIAGAVPIGGLAAYLVYQKITNPAILTHTGQYASAAAWSPDGTRVASIGAYGVQVWEALTGKIVLTRRPKDDLSGVTWSTDGRYLLTLQEKFDGSAVNSSTLIATVEVWNAATGQRVQSILLSKPGYSGYRIALSDPYLAVNKQRQAEGNAATGSQHTQGQAIEIWEIATGQMITTFTSPYEYPPQMLWAPDRRLLASITSDPSNSSVHVEVWDAPVGRRLSAFTLPLARLAPPPVAWLPDGQSLSLGLDVYAIDTGLPQRAYRVDGNKVEAVAWSPDGKRLAMATVIPGIGLYAPATNTIFVLDTSDGSQRLTHYAGGSRTGLNLAFSPDSSYLLVTIAGEVAVWRTA